MNPTPTARTVPTIIELYLDRVYHGLTGESMIELWITLLKLGLNKIDPVRL